MVGILLIALFTLKMAAPVSNLITNKFFSCLKVCTEVEKNEKEEKKSAEKEIKKLENQYFSDRNYASWAGNRNLKANLKNHKIYYGLDHFGSVPTPPPNQAV